VFYLGDDTGQIYEQPVRNSGIVAGTYRHRTRVKNRNNGEYFETADLEIGKARRVCSLLENSVDSLRADLRSNHM
jgi:hypothetical protein